MTDADRARRSSTRSSTCIGHPTGRLIEQRAPYDVDVEPSSRRRRATGTMLEINGEPDRRDLDDDHARRRRPRGRELVLNTDAHRTTTLEHQRWAVATARRAWLTRGRRREHARRGARCARAAASGARRAR